jgi:hypothetical protein
MLAAMKTLGLNMSAKNTAFDLLRFNRKVAAPGDKRITAHLLFTVKF